MPPKSNKFHEMKLDILLFCDQFHVTKVSIGEERQGQKLLHRMYITGKFLLDKQINYLITSVVHLEELEILTSYNKYVANTEHRKMTLELINAPKHRNLILSHDKKTPSLMTYGRDDNFAIMHRCITNAVVTDLMNSGYFSDIDD